jgi:hypothetical protein
MPRKAAGVTVIELVLAVAMLVALAAFTVYAYQTYSIRDQVHDALRAVRPVQALIEERLKADGRLPVDRIATGLGPDSADTGIEEVARLEIVHGRIDLVFGREALERIVMDRLSLTPYLALDGSIAWRCGEGPVPADTVPLDAGLPGAEPVDLATIPDRYLPPDCRDRQR